VIGEQTAPSLGKSKVACECDRTTDPAGRRGHGTMDYRTKFSEENPKLIFAAEISDVLRIRKGDRTRLILECWKDYAGVKDAKTLIS
jgi:hypothetical protein